MLFKGKMQMWLLIRIVSCKEELAVMIIHKFMYYIIYLLFFGTTVEYGYEYAL